MSRRPLLGEPLPVVSRRHPLALLVCACFWELALLFLPTEGATQPLFPRLSPPDASFRQPVDAGRDGFSGANLTMAGQDGMPAETLAEEFADAFADAAFDDAAFDDAALMAETPPGIVPDAGPGAPDAARFSLTRSTGTVTPGQGGAATVPAAVPGQVAASGGAGPEEPGDESGEPGVGPQVSGVAPASRSPEARERFEDRTLERTGRRTMPDIIMHYPVFGMAQVDRDIEAWVEHVALAFERDLSGEPAGGPEACNVAWLNATCAVRFASPVCASVVFDVWMHTGGTELSQDVLTLNYNLLTGQRLHIVDIFENVDTALRLLSGAARRELAKLADQRMPSGFLGSGFPMSDIALSDIENGTFPVPENFSSLALTERGITVHFQPYQVWRLPKAVSVEVPLEELLPAGPLLTLWGKK